MKKKIDKIGDILEADKISSTRVEIYGQKRIEVEGCYGIREYSEEIIQINLPKGTLIIMGSNLQIVILTDKNITLDGKINSIQFEGL